ncbi:MAG: hypothetical protein J0I42_12205 [Bosea sp.]|uniref:hypothetical protein n=1 Tax=Bosea sp. (in: a-proteobacteria) TaxID=1871050 RepID=UPI001AC04CC1|nr:hypothetical protein [Bosea sp. (in: a-proteobacteria)]MBN9452702.1 hypothetical protein [Bosea sp. (in: a-proteobacteria)]
MLGNLRTTIEKHREAISRLKAEGDAVRAAPVDAETITRRLDAEIAKAKEHASGFFAYLNSPGGGFTSSTFNRHAAADAFAFWAACDPDALRAVALESIRAGDMTEEQRANRLTAIDEALEAAEIDEELSLREIDAAIGNHEQRRLDARVDILLAPLAELQAVAKPAKAGGLFRKAS